MVSLWNSTLNHCDELSNNSLYFLCLSMQLFPAIAVNMEPWIWEMCQLIFVNYEEKSSKYNSYIFLSIDSNLSFGGRRNLQFDLRNYLRNFALSFPVEIYQGTVTCVTVTVTCSYMPSRHLISSWTPCWFLTSVILLCSGHLALFPNPYEMGIPWFSLRSYLLSLLSEKQQAFRQAPMASLFPQYKMFLLHSQYSFPWGFKLSFSRIPVQQI